LALTYYITGSRDLAVGYDARKTALTDRVREAFLAGVDFVQVREKDFSARQVAEIVAALATLPERGNSRLLVNERFDIAACFGADGVHLPGGYAPVTAPRGAMGSMKLMVGVSCHNLGEVAEAAEQGASYVLLSPIFATPSKPGAAPLGLHSLETACRMHALPIFALGGVSMDNAAACIQAGAAGVAGIRLFQEAADLSSLCRSLRLLGN
jgi:thiamine-phosphate pyrophosphorylase